MPQSGPAGVLAVRGATCHRVRNMRCIEDENYTGRKRSRIRGFALDLGSKRDIRVGIRDGGKKRAGVGMQRFSEQRLRCGRFHNAPGVHDRNTVADVTDDAEVMGNEM